MGHGSSIVETNMTISCDFLQQNLQLITEEELRVKNATLLQTEVNGKSCHFFTLAQRVLEKASSLTKAIGV